MNAVNKFLPYLQEIQKKITRKTKAVIVVDIAGIPCDYSKIEKALQTAFELNANDAIGCGLMQIECGVVVVPN